MESVLSTAAATVSELRDSLTDLPGQQNGRLSRTSTSIGPPLVYAPGLSRKSSSFGGTDFGDGVNNYPIGPEKRIVLNVAGLRFDVPLSTLGNHPDTLLGNPVKLHRFYDGARDEYYFNRDRSCFESILAYYQSGRLRRPQHVRLDTFVSEARFFQLDHEAFMQFCQDEGFVQEEYRPPPRSSNKALQKLWEFVEMPQSSPGAKYFAILSTLVIILSIIIFCIETLPQFRQSHIDSEGHLGNQSALAADVSQGYAQFENPLFIIESSCIAWFTLEFLLRLISCPDKRKFIKSPMNIIDFVAILPYYIDLIIVLVALYEGEVAVSKGGVLTVLRILRLVRVFRIFKLSRHSRGLQLLGQTFVKSLRELGLLILFLAIGVILFSSAVYYAEQGQDLDTQFTSIPEAFWWAIVTMTTVGYGDIAPRGVFGKIVGTLCAVSGLIAVALPVPIIVSNFNAIYQREMDRPQVEDILSDVLKCSSDHPKYSNERKSSVLRTVPEIVEPSYKSEKEPMLSPR